MAISGLRSILALGYKGDLIKQYFYNYKYLGSNISLKLDPNENIRFLSQSEDHHWEIIFVDTGEDTLKGGRRGKRIEPYIKSDYFYLTYGDGVCDVDINKLMDFHKSHNCFATVTAVRPPSRFGELNIDEEKFVTDLEEKPQMGKGLINGGFLFLIKNYFRI